MTESAEEIIRREAVFFIKGLWPDVIKATWLDESVFANGEEIIIALVPTKARARPAGGEK
jgi:hypothetical protein